MNPIVYPYKMKSSSAKLLAKELGVVRVNPDGDFRNNFKRPIINWGNSETPAWMNRWPNQKIFNHPNAVKKSINKLESFKAFAEAGVKCPEFTVDVEKCAKWWKDGETIVIRKTLSGKGGEGIMLLHKEHEEQVIPIVPHAPLYTKYFKKKDEYRVHVMNGKVIDFVQKKRTSPEANNQIRNHGQGWIFAREGVVLPNCIKEEAIKAVAALGLYFGAVDIGHNVKKNEPCVFEVNSAPGIEGTTLTKYVAAFKEECNEI